MSIVHKSEKLILKFLTKFLHTNLTLIYVALCILYPYIKLYVQTIACLPYLAMLAKWKL